MANSRGREHALVLVNPRARRAGGEDWRERALPELTNRYAVDVVTPGSAAEMTRLARDAGADRSTLVVAAGGDGTVNAVAQGLCGSSIALGILPLGSANDLARELGIPRHDITAAARRLVTGSVRSTDLGLVGDRVFCGVGGIALVARAALAVTRFKQRSPMSRRLADGLGGSVYRISATAALLDPRELDEEMKVCYRDAASGEERELRVRASALFVANHRTLGGGLVLPVETNDKDGAVEICVVPARSRVSLMLNFGRLSSGRRIPDGVLETLRATEAVIETTREEEFVADGERLGGGRRFEIRVGAGALRIVF